MRKRGKPRGKGIGSCHLLLKVDVVIVELILPALLRQGLRRASTSRETVRIRIEQNRIRIEYLNRKGPTTVIQSNCHVDGVGDPWRDSSESLLDLDVKLCARSRCLNLGCTCQTSAEMRFQAGKRWQGLLGFVRLLRSVLHLLLFHLL